MSERPRLLATGVSARALAQCAAAAGWAPVVLDGYGDSDCAGEVHAMTRFSPRRAAALARTMTVDAVAIAAGWEHAPASLARLSEGRRRLAASPAAVRAVRDPVRVADLLRDAGLPALITATAGRTSPSRRELSAAAAAAVASWQGRAVRDDVPALWPAVVKPRHGGGGRDIAPLRAQATPEIRGRYLQEWREGTAVSVVVAADGRSAVPLALTRQLAGVPWLGTSGMTYAGSVVAAGGAALEGLDHADPRLRGQVEAIVDTLARGTGIAGLIGVDGIVDGDGVFWLVEVNPRWCASFELVDALLSTPLFTLHAAACEGRLPAAWPLDAGAPGVAAKGVFYRAPGLPDLEAPALAPPTGAAVRLADLPHPGTALPGGAPVCTLLARAATMADAMTALGGAAAEVRDQLGPAANC